MVVQRKDSGKVDTYVNERETDVEEGGATLEDERGRRVGGMKEVGRYNGDDVDSGFEKDDVEDDDDDDVGIEKGNVENVDVGAGG